MGLLDDGVFFDSIELEVEAIASRDGFVGGHAWRWLDVFSDEPVLIRAWVQERMARDLLDTQEGRRNLARDFATPYAVVNASEDWADTFMLYLRKHESTNAYASRPGGHRKVLAVEAAAKRQAQRLGAI